MPADAQFDGHWDWDSSRHPGCLDSNSAQRPAKVREDNDMNYLRNVGQLFVRVLLFPFHHVVLPMVRFVHLGVTLNAQDDAFWGGLCYLLLVKSLIWLLEYHMR